MNVKKDLKENEELTRKQREMLDNMEKREIAFDNDLPQLSDEELSEFRRIASNNRINRRKENVTLRLNPNTLEKARSLGKGYTSIMSRILEDVINNNEMLKQYL